MLIITAPAKVNLTLEVLGKRPDGFHEIRSVIQTISLGDNLFFQPSPTVDIKCRMPGWTPELSLVSKSVRLVQEATGHTGGVTIEINKRIPMISGLGGDSSDAAATLRGLNRLWNLNLSDDQLRRIAAQIGSDVTFFLYGGTALATGRGENIMQLTSLPHTWFVILVPPVPRTPGKTSRMYLGLNESHYTEGRITVNLVSSLSPVGEVSLSHLINVFDSIALDVYPDLEDYWEQFSQAGAQEIHLCGSGPALFATFKDSAEAETVYNKLQQAEMECFLAESLNE